ncbi:hypothetical protein NM208_g13278 [Fusarium decemcellulare]|uniref:Uncharacterized protein n=1 Tax=Fusarium decemcellulare TaxID=57161 RepID=A0ACC1RKF6_9HYPO|nr:hypothetical protein NM208_g13278 [Fusarium decemcellulare]
MISSSFSIWLLLLAARSASCCFPERYDARAEVLAGQLGNTTISSTEYIRAGTNLSIPVVPVYVGFNSVVNFNFSRVRVGSGLALSVLLLLIPGFPQLKMPLSDGPNSVDASAACYRYYTRVTALQTAVQNRPK